MLLITIRPPHSSEREFVIVVMEWSVKSAWMPVESADAAQSEALDRVHLSFWHAKRVECRKRQKNKTRNR